VVVPSRETPDGRAEGSPVVTKEAQAVGVPVVATDTGGMAETIPPRYRAELVPGDDPDALASRIVALARDPDGRRERAQAGRAWVEQKFDARSLTRRMLEVYARLAGDGVPRCAGGRVPHA
jgi:glycosyltransferase involved in cell wall biosynthesis